MEYTTGLIEWIRTLEPGFLFLLMLQFAVAGAALLQDWLDRRATSGAPSGRAPKPFSASRPAR